VVEDWGLVHWDVRTPSSSLTDHVEESAVDSGRSLPFCYRLCVAVVCLLLLVCCWFAVDCGAMDGCERDNWKLPWRIYILFEDCFIFD
jgi:hypothetical protein